MKNLTLSLLAVAVLSGCGGGGDSKPGSQLPPTNQEQPDAKPDTKPDNGADTDTDVKPDDGTTKPDLPDAKPDDGDSKPGVDGDTGTETPKDPDLETPKDPETSEPDVSEPDTPQEPDADKEEDKEKEPEQSPEEAWIEKNPKIVNALGHYFSPQESYFLCNKFEGVNCNVGDPSGMVYVNMAERLAKVEEKHMEYSESSSIYYNVTLDRFEFSRSFSYSVAEPLKFLAEDIVAFMEIDRLKGAYIGNKERKEIPSDIITHTDRIEREFGNVQVDFEDVVDGELVKITGEYPYNEYFIGNSFSLSVADAEEYPYLQIIANNLKSDETVNSIIYGKYDEGALTGVTYRTDFMYFGSYYVPYTKALDMLLTRIIN